MSAPDDERADDEERGLALMAEGAAGLVDGVARLGPAWVVRVVARRIDQWGRLDAADRVRALAGAAEAGDRGAARVAGELRALFALDPAAQRATPLELVRTLRREATAALRAAGVPEIERDPYETRAFPDDVYGIVPAGPADLDDGGALGGALLAWGLGKSKVLRARSGRGGAAPS